MLLVSFARDVFDIYIYASFDSEMMLFLSC